jgi:cytochrome c-type biogenesis protein CcmF
MIPELGHYALVLALALGLVQSVVPLIGTLRRDSALMQLATSTALAQFLFVAMSFAALTACYVTTDFSVAGV